MLAQEATAVGLQVGRREQLGAVGGGDELLQIGHIDPFVGGFVGDNVITLSSRLMTVTVRDVAQAAGVSQATAARALGGYGYASGPARERVLESARLLGYTPNAVARALVSNATMTVGVVVGDIDNPFFATAARGLTDVFDGHGYTVLLANADEDHERERRAFGCTARRAVWTAWWWSRARRPARSDRVVGAAGGAARPGGRGDWPPTR